MTLTVTRKTINQHNPPAPKKPAPAPKKMPVAPPPQADTETAVALRMAAQELLKAAKVRQEKQPTTYVFDIERGADNYITRVVATPVPKPRLQ